MQSYRWFRIMAGILSCLLSLLILLQTLLGLFSVPSNSFGILLKLILLPTPLSIDTGGSQGILVAMFLGIGGVISLALSRYFMPALISAFIHIVSGFIGFLTVNAQPFYRYWGCAIMTLAAIITVTVIMQRRYEEIEEIVKADEI